MLPFCLLQCLKAILSHSTTHPVRCRTGEWLEVAEALVLASGVLVALEATPVLGLLGRDGVSPMPDREASPNPSSRQANEPPTAQCSHTAVSSDAGSRGCGLAGVSPIYVSWGEGPWLRSRTAETRTHTGTGGQAGPAPLATHLCLQKATWVQEQTARGVQASRLQAGTGRGRGPLYSTHFLSLGPPHTSTSVGRRGSASRGQQGAEPSRGRGCRGIGQPASAQTLPKVAVYSRHPRFTARSVDTTSCRRALRPLTK